MFIFPSQSRVGFKRLAQYFFIAALLLGGWDLYTLIRHGHIIGGVFMAGICLLVALACLSFWGEVRVGAEQYQACYRMLGISFGFGYPFSTYRVLRVEYDCLYARPAQRHPMVLQFYLAPNPQTPKAYWVSLTADIDFAKAHAPDEIAAFIARFIKASGVALIWGDGPFDRIKAHYAEYARPALGEGERA